MPPLLLAACALGDDSVLRERPDQRRRIRCRVVYLELPLSSPLLEMFAGAHGRGQERCWPPRLNYGAPQNAQKPFRTLHIRVQPLFALAPASRRATNEM